MIPSSVAKLLHALHRLAADGVTARIHVADLAAATGLQVRRVQQLARDAEARGLVAITTQPGRGHANTYTLTDAALEMVQRRVPPRTTEEEEAAPIAPFTREKVQSAPNTTARNGAIHPEKVQGNGAKKVQRGVMNDSYPESSRTLSSKKESEDNRVESHSLPPIAPFTNGGAAPFRERLPRLLAARGFAGKNVQTLAQAAAAEDASENDVLKAMIWAERQEARGRIDNWHGYLVACVKQDGWKTCAAKADQRDPITAPAAQSRVAAALRFYEEVESVPASD